MVYSSHSFLALCCAKLLKVVWHSTGPRPSQFGRHTMTPHDAATTLTRLRARRALAQRPRYQPSKLRRYRVALVALRQAGASYRELAYWLRREHHLRVDHTTIRRYLLQLPALSQESVHAELPEGA